jgi:hypothetical protein
MTENSLKLKLHATEGYFYGSPEDFSGFKYMPGYTQLMLHGGHTINIDMGPEKLATLLAERFAGKNSCVRLVRAVDEARESQEGG